jgi:MFS family permease
MNHVTPNPTRSTHVRWLIVLMLMLLAVLAHFNRISMSVAGAERFIPQGLIDPQRMGQIYSVFLLIYTICMLPGGWLIDRVGPTNALTCMAGGMGLCVVLTGLVGWLGVSSWGLWVALMTVRGLAGASSTPLHPGAARTVFLWIPPGSRIWSNGLVTAGALLGIAATYPLFGWLMDQLGWQWAFVACGGSMVLFAVAWRCVAADHATDHAWTNDLERQLVSRQYVPGGAAPGRTLREFLRLFRQRGLVLLSLSYAAVGYFQYLFFYWIEYYFSETLRLPVEASRRASAIVMLAMAAGMACGGWTGDRICRYWGRRGGRRAMAIGGMFISSLCAILGVATDQPGHVVLWFSLALASLGICEGIFWTSVTELGGTAGGLAAAFLNTLGNGGGALAPWLTAVLIQHYNWHVAIGTACVLCTLGGLLWLLFDPAKTSEA